MTAPTQIPVTRDDLELLTWTHPGSYIVFGDSRAYLVLDGVEYVAELTAVA